MPAIVIDVKMILYKGMPMSLINRPLVQVIAAWLTCNVALLSSAYAQSVKLESTDAATYAQVMPEQSSLPNGLPVYSWIDTSRSTKGVVVAVHGTTRHGTSFAPMARHLASNGFRVVSLDLRGHGKWYFSEGPNSHSKIDYTRSAFDLTTLLQQVRAANPRLPIFCLGESIGSAVVIRTVSMAPELVNGVILTSPGTRPHFYNLCMVIPDFIKGISKLDRPLDVSRYINRYASNDARIVDEMLTDPLSRKRLSGKEILQTLFFLLRTPRFSRRMSEQTPVLVLQGARDSIVSKASVLELLDNIRSTNKQLVVLPLSGHVLLDTAYPNALALNAITKWLLNESAQQIEQADKMRVSKTPDVAHFIF